MLPGAHRGVPIPERIAGREQDLVPDRGLNAEKLDPETEHVALLIGHCSPSYGVGRRWYPVTEEKSKLLPGVQRQRVHSPLLGRKVREWQNGYQGYKHGGHETTPPIPFGSHLPCTSSESVV